MWQSLQTWRTRILGRGEIQVGLGTPAGRNYILLSICNICNICNSVTTTRFSAWETVADLSLLWQT